MNSWATNVLTQQTQPWSFENAEMIRASNKVLRAQGSTRRSIVVGIATQYIDTIINNAENSEPHLRAVWHAALTMIHEIGHIIWNHDFNHVPDNGEPYVGDMCWFELGIAFTSWIFSGCTPTTIPTVPSLEDPFDRPLIWRHDKTQKDVALLGAENRPFYVTYWSISTAYLENTLQQNFWDKLGDVKKLGFSAKARARLKSTMISGTPRPATAMVPDFTYDGINPPRWRIECLDRGPQPDTLSKLSKAELNLILWESEMNNDAMVRMRHNDSEFQYPEHSTYEFEDVKENEEIVEADIPLFDYKIGSLTRLEVRMPQSESVDTIETQRRSKVAAYDLFQDFKKGDCSVLYDELVLKEETDVDMILIRTSPIFIANSLTRLEAYQHILDHGLRTGKPLKPLRAWQQSKLLRHDKDDGVVISRIRKHLLYKLFNKYKENSWWFQSALKILQKIGESVLTWGLEDHIEYCAVHNVAIERNDDDKTICLKVYNHFQEDCGEFRRGNHLHVEKEIEYYDPLRAASNITTEWMTNDYINFFTQHHLPTWSSEKVLIERYYAWKWELANGHPRSQNISKFTPKDEDPYWVSRVFHLDPDITSVEALKSAIYTAGTFPANCDFELRILNQTTPLQNHKILAIYASGGDDNGHSVMPDVLELEVVEYPLQETTQQRKRERSESAEPPIFKKRQIIHEKIISTRSSLYKSLIGPVPTPQPPTIAERLASISARSILFSRAMLPSKELSVRRPEHGNNKPNKLPASVLLGQINNAEEELEKINGVVEDTERELRKFESAERERKGRAKGHMARIKKAIMREYWGTGNKGHKLAE
jgi:hypothetical protein